MPIRHSLTLRVCAACLVLMLAGCTSDRLATTAPNGVAQLAGDWKLDPAASDDFNRVIADLHAQLGKLHHDRPHAPSTNRFVRRRRQRGGDGDGDGGSEGAGGGSETGESAEQGQRQSYGGMRGGMTRGGPLVQEFLASVPAGDYLRIAVAPGAVTVTTGESSQEYVPGVQTAIAVGDGAGEQICGWQGNAFVIRTAPQLGPAITQSYGLGPDGRLVMTLRLSGNGIDVRLTRRYERARNAPPPDLPTSD